MRDLPQPPINRLIGKSFLFPSLPMADDDGGGVGGVGGVGGNKKKRKVKSTHSATGAHGGVHLVDDDDFDDPSRLITPWMKKMLRWRIPSFFKRRFNGKVP